MAEILKGAPVAAKITEEVLKEAELLKERGVVPALETIRVGADPSDVAYENGIKKRMEKCGIAVISKVFPEDACAEELLNEIKCVNSRKDIHGCLVFRPLKDKETERAIGVLLSPEKDVDSMTDECLSSAFLGNGRGFAPCTARSVIEILKYYGISVSGKNVAVIGRSLVIGRPVSMLLLAENATVTICHSKSENLREITKKADIVIAAAGRAHMIDGTYLSKGQTVIDVGINATESGITGDVCFDEAKDIAGALTPVPGGVGSVTTSVLAKHVIEAARAAAEEI